MAWEEIKYTVNSSLGTSDFKPLDKIIMESRPMYSRLAVFYKGGSFTVPAGITTIYITACGGGGAGGDAVASQYGMSGTATVIGGLIILPGRHGDGMSARSHSSRGAAGGP